MKSTIEKQSEINWTLIKKLYLQGAQRIHLPEPDIAKNDQQKEINANQNELLKERFEQLIEEFSIANKMYLQGMQKRMKQTLAKFQKRILQLEHQVNLLKQSQSNAINQKLALSPVKIPINMQNSLATKSQHSIIHIQEVQEQSLLDDSPIMQTLSKEFKNRQYFDRELTKPRQHSIQSQMLYSKSQNSRILFNNDSTKEIFSNFQQSSAKEVFQTKQSSIYNCQYLMLKEQVNKLRHFIEEAHSIKIQDFDHLQNNKANSSFEVKKIFFEGSKNSQQHLINQNQKIRDINNKYRQQLVETKEQLSKIRQLLKMSLENQCQNQSQLYI